MKSMTGFGRGEAALGNGQITVTVAAVNRKQFELRFTAPAEFSALESAARKLISDRVSRGSLQMRVTRSGAGCGAVAVDESLLRKLINAALTARKNAGLPGEVAVEELMRVPGVVTSADSDEDFELLAAAFEKALTGALDEFDAMRGTEGEALKNDLAERCGKLETLLARIEPMLEGHAEQIKSRLLEKLAAENIPVSADDERLLKEVLFYADKADVTEEITRLHSHFVQFRNFIQSTSPTGRNLDFLMQEIFREITTLSNKAGEPAVAPLAVAFKSECEKLREQIQNVE